MSRVTWTEDAQPREMTLGKLLYNLRTDASGDPDLLMDAVTMDDLMQDPSIEQILMLDALVVEVGMMQGKMEQLMAVMTAAGKTVQPTGMEIGEPVRSRGVVQVPVLFPMSDGQTVAVWFHNPDATPAKLTPMDMLTSWRWLVNKKDVTIAAAPERGADLQPRIVARRIMAIVEKNSPAFTRANAKAAEKAGQIEALKGEVGALEVRKAGLKRDVEIAREESLARGVAKATKAAKPAAAAAVSSLNEAAGEYGYSVAEDGSIIKPSGSPSNMTAAVKGGRLRITSDTGKLVFTGPVPSGMGDFLSSYWYATKVARQPHETAPVAAPEGSDQFLEYMKLISERAISPSEWESMRSDSGLLEGEVQKLLNAVVAAKAAPGAKVGPFTVGPTESDLVKAIRRGDMLGAITALRSLDYHEALTTVLRAGFSVGAVRTKTPDELIKQIQSELTAAVKAGQAPKDRLPATSTAPADAAGTGPDSVEAPVDLAALSDNALAAMRANIAQKRSVMGPSDPGLAAIEASMLELKAEHERRNAKPAPQNSGSASMADLVRQSQTGAQFPPTQEDPAPAAVGTTVATFSAPNGTEWRIVTGPAGKHNAVLFDTDANESVNIRVFSGADSLEKSTEYARGQAEEANRMEAQPAAPATLKPLPPRISSRVTQAIESLNDAKSRLDTARTGLDENPKIGGGGRYESEVWQKVQGRVAKANDDLQKLRELGNQNGQIASLETLITSLGGVPDVKPSEKALAWTTSPAPVAAPVAIKPSEDPRAQENPILSGAAAALALDNDWPDYQRIRGEAVAAANAESAAKLAEVDRLEAIMQAHPEQMRSIRPYAPKATASDEVAAAYAAWKPLSASAIRGAFAPLDAPSVLTWAAHRDRAEALGIPVAGGNTAETVARVKADGAAKFKAESDARMAAHREKLAKANPGPGLAPAADLLGDAPQAFQTQPVALTPEGAESKVKTAKGTEVVTGYSVVEADHLITSHNPSTGDANPAFPAELQPRDRGRDASIAWVKKTAQNLDPDLLGKSRRADSGAPIVGPDGVVESGNGRTMSVVLAYQTGKADDYRAWLEEEAGYFGLKPEKVKAMKRPVLVRIRTSKVDRAAFAIEANQSDTLAMTATEKAKSDARRMDDGMIALMTENGDLAAAENVPFLSAFLRSLGESEAAQYSTTDGKPTSTLIARVQAAIFAKAYNDDRLLELTADVAKPEIANIVKALNHAAPEFIQAAAMDPDATSAATGKLTDAVEKSLNQKAVDALLGASNVIRQAKDAGQSVDEFVGQSGLFGDIDPDVAAMAVFIAKNNRSAKRMGEAFKAMAAFIKGEIQRRQTSDMFGDSEPVAFKDIVAAANRELERMYGPGVETIGLFDRPAAADPAEPEPVVHDNQGRDMAQVKRSIEAEHQRMLAGRVHSAKASANTLKNVPLPEWTDLEGIEVLRVQGSNFVAVPSNGKRTAATFDILQVEPREFIVQLKKQDGVASWLHKNAAVEFLEKTGQAASSDPADPDPYAEWLDQVIAAVAKDREISADKARSVVTAGPNAAKTAADMRRSFEAMYAPGTAAYAHFGADPTKGLKRTPQETDPEPDFDPVAAVNAAYNFDKATDDFKAELAQSLDDEDYSPFATAREFDQAVKSHGGTVSWALVPGAILDSAAAHGTADDEDDWGDVSDDWGDADGELVTDGVLILDGDFAGHPFRGNQHRRAKLQTHHAARASREAKRADRRAAGHDRVLQYAHSSAAHAHKQAAKGATGKTKSYHAKMAAFHAKRAKHHEVKLNGEPITDSVGADLLLDSAWPDADMVILDGVGGDFQGVIRKGARVLGRAVIGGDGKGMIYTGAKGAARVTTPSGLRAIWGESPGVLVESLFAAKTPPTKPTAGTSAAQPEKAMKMSNEPTTTASASTASEADAAYLRSIIAKKIDLSKTEVMDRIEALIGTYERDAEMTALIESAVEVIKVDVMARARAAI